MRHDDVALALMHLLAFARSLAGPPAIAHALLGVVPIPTLATLGANISLLVQWQFTAVMEFGNNSTFPNLVLALEIRDARRLMALLTPAQMALPAATAATAAIIAAEAALPNIIGLAAGLL